MNHKNWKKYGLLHLSLRAESHTNKVLLIFINYLFTTVLIETIFGKTIFVPVSNFEVEKLELPTCRIEFSISIIKLFKQFQTRNLQTYLFRCWSLCFLCHTLYHHIIITNIFDKEMGAIN